MDNTELTHHGIRGMKWGIRRFQNKDGSLTLLGKKRIGQKDDSDAPAKPKPKSVKEMTDEELTQKIRRLQLEQQYANLQPKKVSKGKEIANKFLDQAIVPAATNMGKQFLEKQLKKALGLDDKKDDNSLDAMKKKLDELRTTNQLYNQKKTYEKNKAEMEAERKAKEDAEKAERDAKKAEKKAKKEAKKAAKEGSEILDKYDFESYSMDRKDVTDWSSSGGEIIETYSLEEWN